MRVLLAKCDGVERWGIVGVILSGSLIGVVAGFAGAYMVAPHDDRPAIVSVGFWVAFAVLLGSVFAVPFALYQVRCWAVDKTDPD